jgi:IS30 family transposase
MGHSSATPREPCSALRISATHDATNALIQRYTSAQDTADRTLPLLEFGPRYAHLTDKIKTLRDQMRRTDQVKERLKADPDGQLSQTDPDARSMMSQAKGTLIERTSRYVMLAKLGGCDAQSALEGFTRRPRSVPLSLRKTLTYDQGTEMALQQTLAKRLKMSILFCDPHSPCQRASKEKANGLILEYLPKGVDLSGFTQAQLTAIEIRLHTRSRKMLAFQTPDEVFSCLKLKEFLSVALQA